MKTTIHVFPFDLFGSSGAAEGALLLADEVREVLADNRRESVRTRARAYTRHVRVHETPFETLAAYNDWRTQGRHLARPALVQGDFLIWLGGNHLSALPIYDELSGRQDVLIVQLDGHLDIHHFDDCTRELSHGNFLLHAAGPLPPLCNVGHRDLLLPADRIQAAYRQTWSALELAADTAGVLAKLRELSAASDAVYLDLDCDVFDSAAFPAVAQPVPFGLPPLLVLQVIEAVWSPRVRGLFVSEFVPGRDHQDRCLGTLVWLLEHVLLRAYEEEG
jgi:arginase family enzyme